MVDIILLCIWSVHNEYDTLLNNMGKKQVLWEEHRNKVTVGESINTGKISCINYWSWFLRESREESVYVESVRRL